MGIAELLQQKSFLGKEFLTWLWYRSETDPHMERKGSPAAEVEVMGPIVLDAHYGDAREAGLKGDAAVLSPEAGVALRQGKKLKRARVKISCDAMDWTATIDGEKLAVTGLNVPAAGKLPFAEGLRLRADYIFEFETILSDMFEAFILLRLDEPSWKSEIEKIQAWVAEK